MLPSYLSDGSSAHQGPPASVNADSTISASQSSGAAREIVEMDAEPKDSIVTIAAVGLLAYASADIAHHALGHGGACLALGGRIISLSSIYVQCTLRGATIDLAGPFANLAIGLIALLVVRFIGRPSVATRLFFVLAGATNLLWFSLQLVFSAATRTDDWPWAMHVFHVSNPVRYGMIAFGAVAYFVTLRVFAIHMASLAHPVARAWKIVLTSWLMAGTIACATAAFDHNAVAAILRHAAPQSFLLSIGLLLLPTRAARISVPDGVAPPLAFSIPWIIVAVVVGVASIIFLGPGVAIGG